MSEWSSARARLLAFAHSFARTRTPYSVHQTTHTRVKLPSQQKKKKGKEEGAKEIARVHCTLCWFIDFYIFSNNYKYSSVHTAHTHTVQAQHSTAQHNTIQCNAIQYIASLFYLHCKFFIFIRNAAAIVVVSLCKCKCVSERVWLSQRDSLRAGKFNSISLYALTLDIPASHLRRSRIRTKTHVQVHCAQSIIINCLCCSTHINGMHKTTPFVVEICIQATRHTTNDGHKHTCRIWRAEVQRNK